MENRVLGQKIKLSRKLKGITSGQLANMCNVYPGHIRQIESGMRLPSLKLLIDICKVLQVSPEYLLSQELKNLEQTKDINDSYQEILKKINRLIPNELSMLDGFLDTYFSKLESIKKMS